MSIDRGDLIDALRKLAVQYADAANEDVRSLPDHAIFDAHQRLIDRTISEVLASLANELA